VPTTRQPGLGDLLLFEVLVLELAVDDVEGLDVGLLADVVRRGRGAGVLLERGDP
jgi:hypothetical protein